MIARFFSTSKPIHLVLVTLFAAVLFSVTRYSALSDSFSLKLMSIELLMFLVVFISISVFSFFVSKNHLTLRNSYKILFFVLFIALVPITLKNNNVLWANLFVLIAIRRVFSLKTNIRVKKKLFDAAFWITIAALFYFWSILFFALIFTALLLFSNVQIKNWIIPLIGFLCVVIILLSYFSITANSFEGIFDFVHPIDFDFSPYNTIDFIIGITILLSLALWATFFYIKSFTDKQKQMISSHVLVLYLTLIATIVILISPNKDGSEFIFLFAPFSIIMANFIESNSEQWFSEVFIWLLLLTPVIKLFV